LGVCNNGPVQKRQRNTSIATYSSADVTAVQDKPPKILHANTDFFSVQRI
jgi:hypothetical protein